MQKFDVNRFDFQRPLVRKLKHSIRFISEGLPFWDIQKILGASKLSAKMLEKIYKYLFKKVLAVTYWKTQIVTKAEGTEVLFECFSCHTTSTELVSGWWPCALEWQTLPYFPRFTVARCGKSGATQRRGCWIQFISKSEYLSYNAPRNMTFFDTVTVKFCSFSNVQKKLPISSCPVT